MNKLSMKGRIAILAVVTLLLGGTALAVNYLDSTPVQGAQPAGTGAVTNPFLMGVQTPDGSVRAMQDPSATTAPVRPTDVVVTGIGPSACAAGLDGGTVALDPSLRYRMFATAPGCINLSAAVTSCTTSAIAAPSTTIRVGDHQPEEFRPEAATPTADAGPSDAAVYYLGAEGSGTSCVQFKLLQPK